MSEIHLWQNQRNNSAGGQDVKRAREVVRHTGGIVRGKFPSRKCRRMIHHEGLLELDAFYLFEASPLIASYREQPCTIYYPDGERLRKYTPDIELTLSSGELVLVEIKPALTALTPEMAHKLACIHAYFTRCGIRFLVLTDEVIRQQPRLSNLRWIYQMAPRTHPTPEQSLFGLAQLHGRQALTIKAAATLLEPHTCDPYTYLLTGQLRLSLDQPVSATTPIYFAKESNDDWFQFSGGLGF